MNPDSEAGTSTRELTVTALKAGQRLDVWLAALLPDLSRARVQQLLDEGRITLNGHPAKASHKVRAGEVARVDVPAPRERPDLQAENIPLDVLHEDADFIAINKPPGLVVHPAPGHEHGTLVNALLHHCQDLRGIGGEHRPGLVHRLDKDTSGVLVVGKHEVALRALQKQFKARSTRKTYQAIARGEPDWSDKRVDTFIGRSADNRKKMCVTPPSDGRNAISVFRVTERLGAACRFEVDIETGRTHQIRVHAAHLGHAILGDALYGRGARVEGAPSDRQMLHAWRLRIRHPATGKPMELVAPPPADFEACLAALRALRLPRAAGAPGATAKPLAPVSGLGRHTS